MVKILNTRPFEYAAPLTQDLKQNGFGVIAIPMIEFSSCNVSFERLDFSKYQGLFFSSLTGWKIFHQQVKQNLWSHLPIYTLSKQVHQVCIQEKIKIGYVSQMKSWKGFLEEISELNSTENWLHLCSKKTNISIKMFAEKNIVLENYSIYEPVLFSEARRRLRDEIKNLDGVLLTAGSIAQAFFDCVELLPKSLQKHAYENLTYYCLGDSAYQVLKKYKIQKYLYYPQMEWKQFLIQLKKNV